MAAAQLGRKGIASVLIEGGGRAGLGAAYSTSDPAHLLNVPAGNMSAWPDVPDDFARRAGDPEMFAERRQFGAYLRTILDEKVGSGCTTVIGGRAIGAKRAEGGWKVELERGTVSADALVLATGNQPPGRLKALESAGERLIANPWSDAARQAIAEVAATDAPVLIVGTGLTMVDVVLSLDAVGHQGRIVALSRRGQIPRGHAPLRCRAGRNRGNFRDEHVRAARLAPSAGRRGRLAGGGRQPAAAQQGVVAVARHR